MAHQLFGGSTCPGESSASSAGIMVVKAAEAWATAMEAVKDADEERRVDGNEEAALEQAESALYDAVLTRRLRRRSRRMR